MTRLSIALITASVLVVSDPPGIGAQSESIPELEQSYLQKAVEADQAEVVLGQLALQKGSHDQVKQYGARMIQDHKRASDEAHKLTSKDGTTMPTHLSMPHQQMQQRLSQLSGPEFDNAYISFMVQDHMKNLHELEQYAQTLTDPRAEHSITRKVKILKDHLRQVKAVAATIGVIDNEVSTQEAQPRKSLP